MDIIVAIITGVAVFVLGQLLIRFVIQPLQDFKKVIAKVSHVLIYYADVYSNPGGSRRMMIAETRKALRDSASLLRSRTVVIPFYTVFSWLRWVPTRHDINQASGSLIGLSNSLVNGDVQYNATKRETIKKSLRLDNDDHPPPVVEQPVKLSFAFRTFIRFTSLVMTVEAAIFLAKGNLFLSAENIALLAATRIGYNPELVASLAQQSADTWVGVILLLIAFLLQMWSAFWTVRYDDLTGTHRGGIVSALVFSLALGIAAFAISERIAENTAARVKIILRARGVG